MPFSTHYRRLSIIFFINKKVKSILISNKFFCKLKNKTHAKTFNKIMYSVAVLNGISNLVYSNSYVAQKPQPRCNGFANSGTSGTARKTVFRPPRFELITPLSCTFT